MFGKRITIFKLMGFSVRMDWSWLIIALLVTWSLAAGVFPSQYKNLSQATYWIMGAACAAGLFISIVVHELFHSLVARRFDLPMTGITLFVFGGVAEMEDEPQSPKAEFLMAIAGPLTSVALGLLVIFALAVGSSILPVPVRGVLAYLAYLNLILGAFNLVPAFPLDGGRVLRSALWQWKKDYRWATRIASRFGAGFGLFLVLLGVLNVVVGNVVGGIWEVLIGLFVRMAAQSSYQYAMLREALQGATVESLMRKDPVTVPGSITLREFVEEYVYVYHYKLYPVMQEDRLLGSISTRQVREIPKEEWDRRLVADVAAPISEETAISPGTDALQALTYIRKDGARLMVVDDGRLAGMISNRDIMSYLAVKMELDEGER